jgi:hypothetical protein
MKFTLLILLFWGITVGASGCVCHRKPDYPHFVQGILCKENPAALGVQQKHQR